MATAQPTESQNHKGWMGHLDIIQCNPSRSLEQAAFHWTLCSNSLSDTNWGAQNWTQCSTCGLPRAVQRPSWTLLTHGQLLVNCWSTTGQPVINLELK